MEAVNFIMENWEQLFAAVTSFVGAFALVASFTPNSADNELADKALKFVNFLGANFGNAKNKDD